MAAWPTRPGLIRPADDGPRRAETGEHKKGVQQMGKIAANAALILAAGVLFLGVVAEKDKEKHTNITWAFIATLGTIAAVNTIF